MIVKNPLTLKFLSACKFKSKLFFKEDELKDDDKQKINNYFKLVPIPKIVGDYIDNLQVCCLCIGLNCLTHPDVYLCFDNFYKEAKNSNHQECIKYLENSRAFQNYKMKQTWGMISFVMQNMLHT
jgi:uncharacterized protein (DUF2062 family)